MRPLAPDTPRRRICIVTPGQIGSNPRVVKEADALHAAGYDVTVVATRTSDVVEPRDRALMRRIPWSLHRVDLGSRFQWRTRRAAQMAALAAYRAVGSDRIAEYAFSPYSRALMRPTLGVPADLYIAHYPAALPVAFAAARRHGACLAYDAEDFHLGQAPDDPVHDEERALLRVIEGRHLHHCAYVTAASPGIADALVDAYGITRPHVVLNVFPLDQSPPTATPRGDAEPRPSVYWFSQTIGPNRGLECAINAIALAESKPHLYLRGTLAKGFDQDLQSAAEALGVAECVHLLPPEAPDEMVREASRYDVGLCCEPGHTLNNRIALTNKLLTYCLAGLPPLMSDIPAQVGFAEKAALGDLVYPGNDAVALASIMDRSLEVRRLDELRTRVWRGGQERWNWEQESLLMLRAVHDAIGPASASKAAQQSDPRHDEVDSRQDQSLN